VRGKFQKEKKLDGGWGKKSSKSKTEIKAKKGKEKKVNLPTTLVNTWTKKIPSMHHSSMTVH
jgi:hypothetical protein